MTPKSLFTELSSAFKNLKWPGSSNTVFGNSVYIVPEIPISQISQMTKPSIYIVDQGQIHHQEHNGLCNQNFSLAIFIENVGINYGEGVVMGRNEISLTSIGKGHKDITELVFKTLYTTEAYTSGKIVFNGKSTQKASVIGNNYPLSFIILSFVTFCSYY